MNFVKRNINSLILVIVGVFFFLFCLPFASWILFAAIICFAIKPLQNKILIQKLKMNEKLSAYVILTLILFILVPFILAFLSFFTEGNRISKNIKASETIESVEIIVSKAYAQFPSLERFSSRKNATEHLKKGTENLVEPTLNLISKFFMSLPMFFLSLFIFSSSVFYFIVDSKSFYTFITNLDFIKRKELDDLIEMMQSACRSTLYAAFITGFAQSLILTLTAFCLGFHYFFTMFFITFFVAQIPLIGTLPITAGLMGYFYINSDLPAAIVILIAGVLAGLSDNLIRPFVFSTYDSLHPFAGLMSSIGGLIVLGPVGVLLGPVLTLLFIKILKQDYKIII